MTWCETWNSMGPCRERMRTSDRGQSQHGVREGTHLEVNWGRAIENNQWSLEYDIHQLMCAHLCCHAVNLPTHVLQSIGFYFKHPSFMHMICMKSFHGNFKKVCERNTRTVLRGLTATSNRANDIGRAHNQNGVWHK